MVENLRSSVVQARRKFLTPINNHKCLHIERNNHDKGYKCCKVILIKYGFIITPSLDYKTAHDNDALFKILER